MHNTINREEFSAMTEQNYTYVRKKFFTKIRQNLET